MSIQATLAQVRASIYTRMDAAVGSLARTYDYNRLVIDEAQKEALLVKNGILHVWYVSLADEAGAPFLTTNSARIEGRNPANSERGLYLFCMHGYYAWNDANASEKTWADIVESVINAFRADKKLGNSVIDSGPTQWRDGKPRMYPRGEGGVLCHYARLDISVFVQTE